MLDIVTGSWLDEVVPKNQTTTRTARQIIDGLAAEHDAAIQSAMVNAYDMGLREDADDDGQAFWAEVLGQVTA